MEYRVVFDVTQTEFSHWPYLANALLLAASAVGAAWYNRSSGGRLGPRGKQFILMLCLFSIFAAVGFALNYQDYLELQSALRHSQCRIAEGVVTNFHYTTSRHSAYDVFFVNGNRFEYSGRSGQNGFHQRGIIRDGLPVRIFFAGQPPNIARLEIAQ